MTNQEAIAAVKRNPISFGCGALALVLAVTQYLRIEEIPGAEAELSLRTADRDRVSLNIKYSAQLAEQEAAMTAALKTIEGRLIRPGELGINTQYFYELETATGVKMLDLRQSNPAAATTAPGGAVAARAAKITYVPVGFTVSVQGTLPQLLDFLRQLENGAHYCRILTASFGGSAAARKTVLSLSLSLEVLGQQ
jgi:hypothetical protein